MEIEQFKSSFFDSNLYKSNSKNWNELEPFREFKDYQGFIQPIVDINTCLYTYQNVGLLQSIINAIQTDSFGGHIHTNDDALRSYWNFNKPEWLSAIKSFLIYGFAVILFDSEDTFVTLSPLNLLFLSDKVFLTTNNVYYDIITKTNEGFKNKVMILTETNFESNYFSYPLYYSIITELQDYINDKTNSLKSSANGSNPHGIVLIETPPKKDKEQDLADAIKAGLGKTGSGLIFVKHTQNYNQDKTSRVDYTEFKGRDYLYSKDLYDRIEKILFSLYKIPPTRLGEYNTSTTRNSSTAVSIYSIYESDLKTFQNIFYKYIDFINELVFNKKVNYGSEQERDLDNSVEFILPSFSNNELIITQEVYNLLNTSAITQEEARLILAPYFLPDVDLTQPFKQPEVVKKTKPESTTGKASNAIKKILNRSDNNQRQVNKINGD